MRAWSARGTVEQAWEGVRAVAGAGSALRRAVCPAPVSGWSLSLFFFFFFKLVRLGFRIYSFLCPLILAGRRGGVSGPFGLNFSLHTPTPPLSPRSAAPEWGELGGTEFCFGCPLLLGLANNLESLKPLGGVKERVLGAERDFVNFHTRFLTRRPQRYY